MILDKEFIEEKIIELTKEIETKETFMKYAKEQEVRLELRNDIYILSLQRDIYLNFYDFDRVAEEMKNEEEGSQ